MGNGTINGYLARRQRAGTTKLPGILVVHENRGRNPHMEDIVRRLALDDFMASHLMASPRCGGLSRRR
jgi:carboxymethylenebutenolidase